MCLYTFLFSTGIYFMSQEEWAFDRNRYWEEQNPIISYPTYTYYIIEISHYVYATMTITYEPKQTDFFEMIIHHFSTIILMVGSLIYGHWRIGISVTLITDLSDPFLELAKSTKYSGRQEIADHLFTLFAIVFIVTRMMVYPYMIIIPAFSAPRDVLTIVLIMFLFVLQALFCLWTYTIFKIAYQVKAGLGADDTRDEDD